MSKLNEGMRRNSAARRKPIWLLWVLLVPALVNAGPLKVSVTTDRTSYAQSDKMRVTVNITNTGSTPVTLPVLSGAARQTYLTIAITHNSGRPVFRAVPGKTKAESSRTLRPGESVQVVEQFNEPGIGFRDAPTAGGPPRKWFSGEASVTASLTVTRDTLPPGAEENAFIGTVSSADRGTVRKVFLNPVTCGDVANVRAAFGKRIAQSGDGRNTPANGEGAVVNIRDLAAMAQQLPAGTSCK